MADRMSRYGRDESEDRCTAPHPGTLADKPTSGTRHPEHPAGMPTSGTRRVFVMHENSHRRDADAPRVLTYWCFVFRRLPFRLRRMWPL